MGFRRVVTPPGQYSKTIWFVNNGFNHHKRFRLFYIHDSNRLAIRSISWGTWGCLGASTIRLPIWSSTSISPWLTLRESCNNWGMLISPPCPRIIGNCLIYTSVSCEVIVMTLTSAFSVKFLRFLIIASFRRCRFLAIALTRKPKCDRPQLPNRFNVRNIIRSRDRIIQAIARQLLDRLDDATISQTTGLSIEDVRNLRSQWDFLTNNNHNCKAPDTLAFLTLEIRIKDPDFTAILGFHS